MPILEEEEEEDVVVVTTAKDVSTSNLAEPCTNWSLDPRRRVCTPSPPLSPLPEKEEPVETTTTTKRVAPKSILRPSKKRRKLLRYRDTQEMVDPHLDPSVASTFELYVFSNMKMRCRPTIGFVCGYCCSREESSSSFFVACRSEESLERSVGRVEQHLLEECPHTPNWLRKGIQRCKPRHAQEHDPRKPYTRLLWKRLWAHAVYSQRHFPRRVRFAPHHQQRLIPPRPQTNPLYRRQQQRQRSRAIAYLPTNAPNVVAV